MGAGHGHQLHFHGHSPVHRMPAHLKLLSLLSFIVLVVATPREQYWAFGVYALLLAGVVAVSGVPAGYLITTGVPTSAQPQNHRASSSFMPRQP